MKKFMIGAMMFIACKPLDFSKAYRSADEFAKNMHASKSECMNIDSDNDGYISCTLFFETRDPYGIQCNWRFGGCKLDSAKAIIQRSHE